MLKLALTLLALTAVIYADELSDCKCRDGFEARKSDDGPVKCYGITSKAILPCNLPERPKCVCTNATTILTEKSGTWCAIYKSGKEEKRWECENKEDWQKFYEDNPSEKPQD